MVTDAKTHISYEAMIKSKNLNSFFDQPVSEEKKADEADLK